MGGGNRDEIKSRFKPKRTSTISMAKQSQSSDVVMTETPPTRCPAAVSTIIDSKVNRMPPREECLFHWITVSSVRMRTLFDAIHNVITEAVMVLDENSISIDRFDNTKTMVVKVKLDHLDKGTYHCTQRLEVGLNISTFHKTLNAVVQNDVLGMCITKKSWLEGDQTLDLYVMNETDMYCYEFICRVLAIEYEKPQLPERSIFNTHISIGCTNFKRYLHDCAEQGDYLQFRTHYDKEKNLIETILAPTGGHLRVSCLKLVLWATVPDDFNPEKFSITDPQEYSIASLSLFTKATTLCKDVVILIADRFPLVVQYDVGDLGVLRFLLAPNLSDEDAYADSEEDEEDEEKKGDSKMTDIPPIEDVLTAEQKAVEQSQELLAKVNPGLEW